MNQNKTDINQIEALLDRYKAGVQTPADIALLESWYAKHEFSNPMLSEGDVANRLFEIQLHIMDAAESTNAPKQPVRIRLWPKLAVAASVLLAIVSIYFTMFSRSDLEDFRLAALDAGIVPGGNKATLTLSNGKKILLDDTKEGDIANQGGIVITKEKNGTVVYTVAPNQNTTNNIADNWNTIETPNGGQYKVVLSDGSKVWLNAQSALRFPSVFSKEMREVEIKGEAFFQISKHHIGQSSKLLPFLVQAGEQKVSVLGTQFNINSYPDEQTLETTLLEGSIAVSHHKKTTTDKDGAIKLVPGEQSQLFKTGELRVSNVDIQETIDWQKGYFAFHNEDIYQIMRKVARWYDIEVIYESELPTEKLGGTLSRHQDVSKLFDAMQSTGLFKFKIQGKKVHVRRA